MREGPARSVAVVVLVCLTANLQCPSGLFAHDVAILEG